MIVVLAGASGAGKSTIGELLRERFGVNLKPVISYTTRERREGDPPGEYANISSEKFERIKRAGKFIWSVFISGNWYGTMFMSLDETKLEPDSVGTLHIHAKMTGLKVVPFYIVSPSVLEIRRRLENRFRQEREKKIAKMRADGVSELDIWEWLKQQKPKDEAALEGRIQDCLKWDELALESKIPYVFVRNNMADMGQQAAATVATEIVERMSA